jgi:hypothetical protein
VQSFQPCFHSFRGRPKRRSFGRSSVEKQAPGQPTMLASGLQLFFSLMICLGLMSQGMEWGIEPSKYEII